MNENRDINKENIDVITERVKLNKEAESLRFYSDEIKIVEGTQFLNCMQDIITTVENMKKNYNNIAGRDVF